MTVTGCASKKYVSQQINPVNQKLNHYEKDTNGKIAWLNNKVDTNVSALNERISTTDQRVSEVSSAVQSAQGTASRAMETADANKAAIEETNTAITDVKDSMNYKLVDRTDVFFAFDKATLEPKAKTELDSIAAKIQGMPRAVVEVAGFADPVGTTKYNLDLSRRRAWVVQRYLVQHNVPARSIHVVGLGQEPTPPGMETPEASSVGKEGAHPHALERRVAIRLFGAGSLTGTNESQQ
jgi:outer membrane protein OmpA-like peptidoglycan-associated protein